MEFRFKCSDCKRNKIQSIEKFKFLQLYINKKVFFILTYRLWFGNKLLFCIVVFLKWNQNNTNNQLCVKLCYHLLTKNKTKSATKITTKKKHLLFDYIFWMYVVVFDARHCLLVRHNNKKHTYRRMGEMKKRD